MSGHAKKKRASENTVPLGQRDSKKQRALLKPFGEVVRDAKDLWNKMREKTVEKADREALVDKIMKLVETNVYEIVARHDASRVIQACFRYGTLDVQKKICAELKSHFLELSMAAYGHFMLKSMLRHGKKEQRDEIIGAFKNNFCKLATHITGASLIELLYQNRGGREFQREIISKTRYRDLAREFYGREFSIFNDNKELGIKAFLEKNPERKKGVLGDMRRVLDKQIGKGIHHFEFVQSFLCEYVELVSGEETAIEDLFPSIVDGTLQLASTYYGSRVVVHALAKGNAKIRKQIVKQLRGRSADVAKHPHGYLVAMKALDCVDDTVLLKKCIIGDFKDTTKDIAMDQNGSKVLLRLMAPNENRYFNSHDLKMLAISGKYSRKDPETRRGELLPGIKEQLENAFGASYKELLENPTGAKVFFEGMKCWGTQLSCSDEVLAFLKKSQKAVCLNKSQIKELTALL